MILKEDIEALNKQIDAAPPLEREVLQRQVWQAQEYLNDRMFHEADEILEGVAKQIAKVLETTKPDNY